VKSRVLVPVLIAVSSVYGASGLQEFRLPNGLRVILSENHDSPLVRFELRTEWNHSEEQNGKEGLGGFLGEALKAGGVSTSTRSAFQGFLEDRALRFSFYARPRYFAWSVLSDNQNQEAAIESLAMAVTRPDLEGAQVEALRQRTIQGYLTKSHRQLAEDAFNRVIGNPDGMVLPEPSILNRIEVADLRTLLKRVLRPERSVLVIQGDVSVSQARQLTMLHLGAWAPGKDEAAMPSTGTTPAPSATIRTWFVHTPSKQVEIKAGGCIEINGATPSSIYEIGTGFLRQAFETVPPANLAKVELTAYPNGTWILTATAREGVGLPAIMETLNDLLARSRKSTIPESELSRLKERWIDTNYNLNLHPKLLADALATRALLEGNPDEPADRIRPSDLQGFFERMFDPVNTHYFVTGSEDGAQLKTTGLGPVEIVN
jgi:hypothetical protein